MSSGMQSTPPPPEAAFEETEAEDEGGDGVEDEEDEDEEADEAPFELVFSTWCQIEMMFTSQRWANGLNFPRTINTLFKSRLARLAGAGQSADTVRVTRPVQFYYSSYRKLY